MKLFTRQVLMTGDVDTSMTWAGEIAGMASDKMGTPISVWAVGFGAPVGALAFTARVEGVADLMAKASGLEGDAAYASKLAEGRAMMAGPPEDSLASPLHGELGDPPPVGSAAVVTNAQIANGKYAEAIGWGIDVAQHVTSITGLPVMLLMQEYGPMGTLTWIGGGADAAAVDASSAAMAGDADYIGKLSAAGDLFVPGSAHRVLANRIA